MARLIATKKMPYRGRTLSPGDEFEVAGVQMQRALIALGRARRADDAEVMMLLDPEFETTTTTEEPVKSKQKRTYKRKDMAAEEQSESTAENDVQTSEESAV